MNSVPISVTLITLNEEANLPDAIKSVRDWAAEIVVVDSGSTDRTVELAKSLGARVLINPWRGFGEQKNFAQRAAAHDWVLSLDADERVSPALAAEIRNEVARAVSEDRVKGFRFPRKTYYLGRWIRHGGWYPGFLTRLADRRAADWTEPKVHEELAVRGEVGELREPLDHYAFPSIREQVLTNLRYASLGAEQLGRRGRRPSVVRLILKPIGKFLETYFLKLGFLDGLPGFIISVNAAHSMFMKHAFQLEGRINRL